MSYLFVLNFLFLPQLSGQGNKLFSTMRNLCAIIFFSIICSVTFSSCQKTPLYTPSVVASIGTFPFSAVGTNAAFALSTTANGMGTTISVVGATANYIPGSTTRPIIQLNIPTNIGSYTINKNCSASITTVESGKTGSAATSGTIAVVGNDHGRIEGTFSFVCADGEKVTNGQFYCYLPQ